MIKKEYQVDIEFNSPFHISSGVVENGFIDEYIIKKGQNPYIPGSTVKGKVRSYFRMLLESKMNRLDAEKIEALIFGGEGYKPSKIYFEDFISNKPKNTDIRYGIRVDRYKKTAKDKGLFNYEIGEKGIYTGKVIIYFDDITINYKEDLEMAFLMVDAIGKGKSKGLGHCKVFIREVTK
ncbi:RAMP superfamily CRISPR-associated protein [Defluviitalea phaphyphila]|uniref:RAMP superfamily CRISPR-associated protein n=1 Tax=Defluviitalea phaphyphila TaxID=1473580 RepID=UPI00073086AD|nr:RAMP superfamily CRISPR-associated protein [Defluviitalea phaphyphila]